jgi:sec-independent protein translocase protein TatA
MGINGSEIFLVVLVFLLLFGAKAIPDLARTLGKGMREFRKATEDIKREINESTSDIKKDINEISSNVTKEANSLKDNIEDTFTD